MVNDTPIDVCAAYPGAANLIRCFEATSSTALSFTMFRSFCERNKVPMDLAFDCFCKQTETGPPCPIVDPERWPVIAAECRHPDFKKYFMARMGML